MVRYRLVKGYRARAEGNRTIYEHREVMERIVGRKLSSDECVHHINENKTDNRPENLKLVTRSTHNSEHFQTRKEITCKCGVKFKPQKDRQKCCSVSCGNIARRKVARPTRDELLRDLEVMCFVSVGKKYGVSDNAIRKWLKSCGS